MRAPSGWLAVALSAGLLLAACGTARAVHAPVSVRGSSQPGSNVSDPIREDEIQTILAEDAIPAITSPSYLSAAAATDIHDSELVLGVAINGDARAYPLRTLSVHEIVDDTIGGKPAAVTW